MIKKSILLLLCLCCAGPLHANAYVVHLGGETVIVEKERYQRGPFFVHLHQNEKTALKAARKVARSSGGSVLTLLHDGGRNIIFHLNGKRYEFDPNRIFTEKGIEKTLRRYGHYSKSAHNEVRKLAVVIKRQIPEGKVIAVHNNQSYSLKDYKAGHGLSSDARQVHFERGQSYRNFFLVTKKRDFLRLKQLNYNGVWQKPNPTDDGSLSVYLAKKPYINVEAGHGLLKSQIRMLRLFA